eukprot:Tamp_10695.p1 GENE.Tamp_10695~~Tamp_10695.p1  ORF type:complete len:294 (-),score=29.31 Tamp_10695:200-1081(-)
MRVALHVGTCVGGIVGVSNPRYHLFGKHVDIVMNMEPCGTRHGVVVSSAFLRLLASGNEVVTEVPHAHASERCMDQKAADTVLLHHPASLRATTPLSPFQGNRMSRLQRSFKHLSFQSRRQTNEDQMVDPVAMCALAQKLLQRQEAQAVSLSQAPLPATELQIPLQENSLESKSPDFKLPIPLPGVPSRPSGSSDALVPSATLGNLSVAPDVHGGARRRMEQGVQRNVADGNYELKEYKCSDQRKWSALTSIIFDGQDDFTRSISGTLRAATASADPLAVLPLYIMSEISMRV